MLCYALDRAKLCDGGDESANVRDPSGSTQDVEGCRAKHRALSSAAQEKKRKRDAERQKMKAKAGRWQDPLTTSGASGTTFGQAGGKV